MLSTRQAHMFTRSLKSSQNSFPHVIFFFYLEIGAFYVIQARVHLHQVDQFLILLHDSWPYSEWHWPCVIRWAHVLSYLVYDWLIVHVLREKLSWSNFKLVHCIVSGWYASLNAMCEWANIALRVGCKHNVNWASGFHLSSQFWGSSVQALY